MSGKKIGIILFLLPVFLNAEVNFETNSLNGDWNFFRIVLKTENLTGFVVNRGDDLAAVGGVGFGPWYVGPLGTGLTGWWRTGAAGASDRLPGFPGQGLAVPRWTATTAGSEGLRLGGPEGGQVWLRRTAAGSEAGLGWVEPDHAGFAALTNELDLDGSQTLRLALRQEGLGSGWRLVVCGTGWGRWEASGLTEVGAQLGLWGRWTEAVRRPLWSWGLAGGGRSGGANWLAGDVWWGPRWLRVKAAGQVQGGLEGAGEEEDVESEAVEGSLPGVAAVETLELSGDSAWFWWRGRVRFGQGEGPVDGTMGGPELWAWSGGVQLPGEVVVRHSGEWGARTGRLKGKLEATGSAAEFSWLVRATAAWEQKWLLGAVVRVESGPLAGSGAKGFFEWSRTSQLWSQGWRWQLWGEGSTLECGFSYAW